VVSEPTAGLRRSVSPDFSISVVATLEDELRRGMYAFIRRAGRPVTRDEAAAVVGISRKLAAFHLDKLVRAGLLTAGYAAVGGRRVGRAPKVYEPSGLDIRISIPQREHGLLAGILIDAVLAEASTDTRSAALRVAREHGRRAGAEVHRQLRPGRLGAERALTLAEGLLGRLGFEPAREDPARLRLGNCPFHPLAANAPDLVCGINQAYLSGVLAGLDAPAVQAVLEPRPGSCCVELRAVRPAGPGG
jgi:predicted ArsR family transcriptional regulator